MTPPQVVGRGPRGAARCLLSKHRKPAHKCVSVFLPCLGSSVGEQQVCCWLCAQVTARHTAVQPGALSRAPAAIAELSFQGALRDSCLSACSRDRSILPSLAFCWHVRRSGVNLPPAASKKKKKKVLSSENCILPLLGREGQLPEASSCLAVK